MKRIAILVNTLQSGGSEKQSICLFNALQDEFETYMVVFHGHRVEEKLLNLIVKNENNIIMLKGNFVKKCYLLLKIFKHYKIKYLFSYLTKPNVIGAFIAKISNVKYVYGSIRNSKLPPWKMVIERFVSNNLCTATIFNNYEGENLFKNKGFINTTVIPNCFIDIEVACKRPINKKIAIISVGRFVEQKDYFTAINAIDLLSKRYPHIQYLVVGYGKLENEIRYEIKKRRLDSIIKVIINPSNIPELLKKADIYLSTSLWEGTSNSIMEALNASLPVVATNVGDNNKLIIDGENGFLNNVKDFNSISESLYLLTIDSNKRKVFGERSNLILRHNYSFEKFKNSYLKLIGER